MNKDRDSFCNEENSTAYYKKIYNEKSPFELGKIFLECIDYWKDYGQIIPKTFSYVLMQVLKPCMIQVICKEITSKNIDDTSCWINMECSLCQKKVSMKKEQSTSISTFFTEINIFCLVHTHLWF